MTRAPTYLVGDIRIDRRTMRISRQDQIIPLESKAVDLLLFLIAHRDRLLTKDELLDAVWPNTFVTPNALTRAIAQIRKALGDDSGVPRLIETVPK